MNLYIKSRIYGNIAYVGLFTNGLVSKVYLEGYSELLIDNEEYVNDIVEKFKMIDEIEDYKNTNNFTNEEMINYVLLEIMNLCEVLNLKVVEHN